MLATSHSPRQKLSTFINNVSIMFGLSCSSVRLSNCCIAAGFSFSHVSRNVSCTSGCYKRLDIRMKSCIMAVYCFGISCKRSYGRVSSVTFLKHVVSPDSLSFLVCMFYLTCLPPSSCFSLCVYVCGQAGAVWPCKAEEQVVFLLLFSLCLQLTIREIEEVIYNKR